MWNNKSKDKHRIPLLIDMINLKDTKNPEIKLNWFLDIYVLQVIK